MVMDIFLKRVDTFDYIFSAMHAPRALLTAFVIAILWSVWKAEVVGSTTWVSVIFSTNYTYQRNNQQLKVFWCKYFNTQFALHTVKFKSTNQNFVGGKNCGVLTSRRFVLSLKISA